MNTAGRAKLWLAVCLLLVSFVPGIYYMRVGIGFRDEAYQILNTLDWYNSPLAPLTGFFGSFLSHFTTDILAFRWLAMSLVWAATLVSGFYLYRRSGNAVASLLITASAIWMSGFNHLKGFMFGWDSFTTITLTAVIISFLEYIRTQKRGWLLFAAILSALCTLCRIPNVVCIFIICIAILVNARLRDITFKKACADSFLYLITALALITLILKLMYGSFSDYQIAVSENMLEEHFWKYLVVAYIYSFTNWLFVYIGVFSALFIFIKNFVTDAHLKSWVKVSCFLFISCVYFTYAYFEHDIVYGLNYITAALTLFGCLFILLRKTRQSTFIGFLLLLFFLIPTAGSNTGLIKIMTFSAIPLLFIYLKDRWNNAATLTYLLVILVYSGLSAYRKMLDNFEDAGMGCMSAVVDRGPMKGILTTPDMAEMINSAIGDVQPYLHRQYKVKVLGRGFDRFGWELTFSDRNAPLRHCWTEDTVMFAVGGYRHYIENISDSAEPVLVFWAENINYKAIKDYARREDDCWEKVLLSKKLTKIPSTSAGYTLFTNTPLP